MQEIVEAATLDTACGSFGRIDGRVLPLELATALPAWCVPLAGALGEFVLTTALTP